MINAYKEMILEFSNLDKALKKIYRNFKFFKKSNYSAHENE